MINFVCALLCEATPIIDHFKLKQTQNSPFSIYSNEKFRLIVSGVGSYKACCATTVLLSLSSQKAPVILVGICGHKTIDINTPLLAHKITHNLEENSYYPSIAFDSPCYTQTFCSFSKPQTHYLEDIAIDMESYGFYSAAERFLSLELIHVWKVVSDNEKKPCDKIQKKEVSYLIEQNLASLLALREKLENLSQKLETLQKKDVKSDFFLDRFRFSVTQRYKLEDILHRIEILQGPLPKKEQEDIANKSSNTHELLSTLKEKAKKIPNIF